jgi:hypothetical protein
MPQLSLRLGDRAAAVEAFVAVLARALATLELYEGGEACCPPPS